MKGYAKLGVFGLLLVLCALIIMVGGGAASGWSGDDPPPDGSGDGELTGPWGPPVGPSPVRVTVPLAPLTINRDDLAANATIVSDDFNACELNPNVWSFVDPLGDSSVSMKKTFTNDAHLEIQVPGIDEHQPWREGNTAPRVMQSVNDPKNFEVEVKFLSRPNEKYKEQGIIVERDPQNFMRLEFYSDDTDVWAHWVILEPNPVVDARPPLTDTKVYQRRLVPQPGSNSPLYLRVRRQGDTWSQYYSLTGKDGEWMLTRSYDWPTTVSKVGVFAGNAPQDSAPPFTAQIDYFFNTAAPISPEDGDRNKLTTRTVGGGDVDVQPDKPGGYQCYDEVTLQAQADLGWAFVGWSGDLTGTNPTAQVIMTGSKLITATFGAGLWALNIDIEPAATGNLVQRTPAGPSYQDGTVVTLTPVPLSGWWFAGWNGPDAADVVKTGSNTWQITMDSNKSLVAAFAQNSIWVPLVLRSY